MRRSNRSVSKPISASADVSGLRSALPGLLASNDGVSTLVVAPVAPFEMETEDAPNVWSAVVRPGCTPLAPYAARRRSELTQFHFGKNDSSDAIQDALTFG